MQPVGLRDEQLRKVSLKEPQSETQQANGSKQERTDGRTLPPV